MTSLAFKLEEITARELKPELYELDGISRASIEAHYRLYEGYVNKRNEILETSTPPSLPRISFRLFT